MNTLTNPLFQEARDVALSILQPSQRDLQHGLELHAAALVVDTYAFAPRALPDQKQLEACAEVGACAHEIEDLRQEMLMTGMVTSERERRYFAECFEMTGVDCLVQSAGEEGNDIETMLKRLARFTWAIDHLRETLRRATSAADILLAREEGKRCLYLATNGVPLPRSFRSVEEGLGAIRTFSQLGVRMMHLTYNRRNLIGDGCAEARDGGLSDFGRAVVREMNRCGVIVDIAHSGTQTGLDAIAASSKPVVVSHAVCGGLSPHCRAKPDEVIRAVADSGGYIGICCLPAFLQGSGDIAAFMDHIDYAVRLVGPEHVAIGTDNIANQAIASEGGENWPRRRLAFENFWPANDAYYDPHWQQEKMLQSLAWTNWPLFAVAMVQRGYSDDWIRMILGENAVRVAKTNGFESR